MLWYKFNIIIENEFETLPRKLRDHNLICDNCKNNIYTCRVCNKESELKVSSKNNQPNILECSVTDCHVYYHKKCVKRFPKTSYNSRNNTFKCPLHYCKKCNNRQKPLLTCIRCPNAYHYNCFTESDGLRISPHRILCYKHKVPEGVVKYKKPSTYKPLNPTHNRYKQEYVELPPLSDSPIEYDIPYEEYQGDWCRYCGARQSSGWNCGPWGSKTLCVSHYVKWRQKKTLDLSDYVYY